MSVRVVFKINSTLEREDMDFKKGAAIVVAVATTLTLAGCSKSPEEKLQSIAKQLESLNVTINSTGQKLTGDYVGAGFFMGKANQSVLNKICNAAGSEDYYSEFTVQWMGKSSMGGPRVMTHNCKL